MAETGGDIGARMIGAALLNVDTFEEVEADQSATIQAAGVVALAAACMAIGSWGGGLGYAAWVAFLELGSWAVWAGIAFIVGDKVFGADATWGELLRTLGFAKAAGVLYLLGVVPLLGGPATVVVGIWVAVASFIGLRQALDISNGKTALTWLVGALFYGVLKSFPFFPF